jgi:hypothetical protein
VSGRAGAATRRVGRARAHVAARAEGPDLRADGWNRRRADDVAAGGIGGPRNWDYRYCWLRDATLTLVALIDSGYLDEAARGASGCSARLAGRPADLQIMYGVAGERRSPSTRQTGFPATRAPGPVRVGNAASEQVQLDVYGKSSKPSRPRGSTASSRRPRLAALCEPARVPRRGLAPAGLGHLGGARAEPPLHALEGHGLGGVRPCAPHERELGARRPGRPLAGDPGRDPRPRLRERLRPRSGLVRTVVRLATGGRESPADPARRLPARRRRNGSSARSMRSDGRLHGTG